MAPLSIGLAIWYLSWLLRAQRVGDPALFGVLVAAESFNLTQAAGFWWTCACQRMRAARAPSDTRIAVDVMIPVFNEPLDIVEPTVAAACRLRGADARVWLLDDGRRPDLALLAGRYRIGYLRRRRRGGAKAGNLNHALQNTDAPFVAVLDCDHVPHADFLEGTIGHLEDSSVAFVQTPQHYANVSSGPVPAAAAAQQALFFGPISRGKDGLGAMFCCGTNVVFRRDALHDAGGFPERSLTEDFELSIALHERGWRSVYVPEVLVSGLGPEDMAAYVSQQQRWARGCVGAIPRVLRARLPWRTRVQYLLSASYFLSGWTLVVYMSLPVLRLLFGLQPLAQVSADQFLLHFAPYWCSALAAVALAGSGTYTFGAFALQACNFWIHVQATLTSLLRRTQGFVVTRKRGTSARQPRAVAPSLAAIAVLVGAGVVGLERSTSPATLNNVAFAALHASVLLTGALPALRVRSSGVLAPEPPVARRAARRWPRPVVAATLSASLAVPVGLALVGAHALRAPQDPSVEAHASAERFLNGYVTPSGRVVRRDQGGDTVSEGQAYGMLVAVALDDWGRFGAIWNWTRTHLRLHDGLLASRWADGRVQDAQPATDADLDAAHALVLAGERFGSPSYRRAGATLARAVLAHETLTTNDQTVLLAGPWAHTVPAVLNPSYFSPRSYADLQRAAPDRRWGALELSSRAIASKLIDSGRLPPDWAALGAGGTVTPIGNPGMPAAGGPAAMSSFDALRVAIRYADSCAGADRRVAARLWRTYERAPGRGGYMLTGAPTTRWRNAASLVAAAAAAQAAGHRGRAAGLIGQAEAQNAAHPSYYGSAWVALGQITLQTAALGTCR
jgi:cellulose synthase (UDP-forming)